MPWRARWHDLNLDTYTCYATLPEHRAQFMYLVIQNLPADTTVEDIADFFAQKKFTDYERIELSGVENPVALVACSLTRAEIRGVAGYLDRMVWKGKTLRVYHTNIFTPSR